MQAGKFAIPLNLQCVIKGSNRNNCHPTVVKAMRLHYPKPHFLPEDAEIPHDDFVFMGYGDAASMHVSTFCYHYFSLDLNWIFQLDFINRLMWQAQLKGSKVWNLMPPSECQNVCRPISFSVYPGDAGQYFQSLSYQKNNS